MKLTTNKELYDQLYGPLVPPALPFSPIEDELCASKFYWDKCGPWRYRLIWRACLSPIDYQVLGSYYRPFTATGERWEASINMIDGLRSNRLMHIKICDDELTAKAYVESHAAKEYARVKEQYNETENY